MSFFCLHTSSKTCACINTVLLLSFLDLSKNQVGPIIETKFQLHIPTEEDAHGLCCFSPCDKEALIVEINVPSVHSGITIFFTI